MKKLILAGAILAGGINCTADPAPCLPTRIHDASDAGRVRDSGFFITDAAEIEDLDAETMDLSMDAGLMDVNSGDTLLGDGEAADANALATDSQPADEGVRTDSGIRTIEDRIIGVLEPCDPHSGNSILYVSIESRNPDIAQVVYEQLSINKCGYISAAFGPWVEMINALRIKSLIFSSAALQNNSQEQLEQRYASIIGQTIGVQIYPKVRNPDGSLGEGSSQLGRSNTATHLELYAFGNEEVQNFMPLPGQCAPVEAGDIKLRVYHDRSGTRHGFSDPVPTGPDIEVLLDTEISKYAVGELIRVPIKTLRLSDL